MDRKKPMSSAYPLTKYLGPKSIYSPESTFSDLRSGVCFCSVEDSGPGAETAENNPAVNWNILENFFENLK